MTTVLAATDVTLTHEQLAALLGGVLLLILAVLALLTWSVRNLTSTSRALKLHADVNSSLNDELRQCVKDVRFSGFVNKTTSAITQQTGTGVLGLAEGAQLQGRDGLQSADGPQFLQGTPLVIVNGQEWKSGVSDYSDFEEYLLKLKAELEGANGEDSGASTADESETE
mgnify:CR=1 FL=1